MCIFICSFFHFDIGHFFCGLAQAIQHAPMAVMHCLGFKRYSEKKVRRMLANARYVENDLQRSACRSMTIMTIGKACAEPCLGVQKKKLLPMSGAINLLLASTRTMSQQHSYLAEFMIRKSGLIDL